MLSVEVTFNINKDIDEFVQNFGQRLKNIYPNEFSAIKKNEVQEQPKIQVDVDIIRHTLGEIITFYEKEHVETEAS